VPEAPQQVFLAQLFLIGGGDDIDLGSGFGDLMFSGRSSIDAFWASFVLTSPSASNEGSSCVSADVMCL